MKEKVVRLDKWLWAARFFKTRSLAAQAVSGGKAHLNGQRVKPGRSLKAGDMLNISRGNYTFEINVLDISSRRKPAREACLLYEETESSKQVREALEEMLRLASNGYRVDKRKPNKRERDHIIRFKRKFD
jgi:ribosome-associated heat shock protein Hsp15